MERELELKIKACSTQLKNGVDWEDAKQLANIHNMLCDIVETGYLYESKADESTSKLKLELLRYEDLIRKVRTLILKQIKP